MFLPAELFTERELLKPEDFQTDQQEKPKQSEKSTTEREAKVGHKRGHKLRKVSGGLQIAEGRGLQGPS